VRIILSAFRWFVKYSKWLQFWLGQAVRFEDHTNDPDPRKMLEQMHKIMPASSNRASVKPASRPVAGVPVAHLTNK
jgi:hypothetical protein